jgi:glucans biosynthesis protein C
MAENKAARLFYLDNMRIFLISLIVLLHLAITYGAPGDWEYNEVSVDDIDTLTLIIFALFNGTVQSFSLGLFFMISGYFTAISFDRKGTGQFLKDRFVRLGIPLMIFVIFIYPVMTYILRIVDRGDDITFFHFIVEYIKTTRTLGVGPLWYVEALLLFSVIYALWRRITRNIFESTRFIWNVPGNTVIALFALVVGIMSFTVRIWLPVFWSFELLGFQFPHFSQYICFFTAGIWAYRGNWFNAVSDGSGKFWLILSPVLILLFPVVIFISGATEGDMSIFGGLNWKSFVYSLWEQFLCAGMAVGLTVLFRKRFNFGGKFARTLSASTYTVYIIHAPVIILLCLALKNITVYPLLKFVLVAPVAVTLCFLLGYAIRKLPYARKIL